MRMRRWVCNASLKYGKCSLEFRDKCVLENIKGEYYRDVNVERIDGIEGAVGVGR